VNVAQDYGRLFGEPPKQPRGIALLTDADDTKSAAVGDYTDFRVCPAEESPAAQPENGKPAAGIKKPAKPAAAKRVEKPQAVQERTPPVDRPPIRYSRPAAAAPAMVEPEKP
jgi:hypothetical protein